eukprot:203622_1
MFILVPLLVAINVAFAADCSYFNEVAMGQCFVIPWEVEWDGGRTDVVGRMVTCSSGEYVVSAYEDNQCEDEIKDSSNALSYPIDVTAVCDEDDTNCHCGTDDELDTCYIELSDYKVCKSNPKGNYDEDDLYFSYFVSVGSCYRINKDDEQFDPDTSKWAIHECQDNEFEPFIKTYYLDNECTQEFREPVLDCVVNTESFDCDATASVESDYYCGIYEGKPLGVCAVQATWIDTDVDPNTESYRSELYFCDAYGKYFKRTFRNVDCTDDGNYIRTEPVQCDSDHNCECKVSGGINTGDCEYNVFSLTQSKTCEDADLDLHVDVTYTAIVSDDTCVRSDDHLHGVKYQCEDATTLDFTLYLNDQDCSEETSCEYTKTVDCTHATGTGDCGYFKQYPVGQCANTTSYTDEEGNTVTSSTMFMCDSDGNLETYTYANADCSGTQLSKLPCEDCEKNDDGEWECNECKYYKCGDAGACNLAEFHQNVVCMAGGVAAESWYNTEYLVIDECAAIHAFYQETVCLNDALIEKTVYVDEACSTARDVCVVSSYDGGFDLDVDQNEEVLSCVTADSDADEECGFVHVFPLNECVISFESNHEEAYSAMYTCADDAYKANFFANDDCSGKALHMIDISAQCGSVFECSCASGPCSYIQMEVHDTCLNTDTSFRAILPSDCNKIEDSDLEWDIYLGIKCDPMGEVRIGFYEDKKCENAANILRYKDEEDCTHYLEYDGVCGQYPKSSAFNARNSLYQMVVVVAIFIVLDAVH